ncbi:MAG: tetratricopeptide repeat protein [Planctomycetota bacterium]|nr:tetratricopeptide repeat protein [Planctomycetota bacterium]
MSQIRKLPVTWPGPLAGVGMCLLLLGCNNVGKAPSVSVGQELANRQAARARSMNSYYQGQAAFDRQDMAAARNLAAMATREDDRNAYAWMLMGAIESEEDNPYKAVQAFSTAAHLAPERYEPHFNIGLVLESVGQYSKAIKKYEAALKLSPDQVDVMENLARCYIQTGANAPRVRELVTRALEAELRPEWVQWLHQQAKLLSQKREKEKE